MRNTLLAALCALPCLCVDLRAQDTDPVTGLEDSTFAFDDESVYDFKLGLDFTDKYFLRGIRQEDRGFIAQPWAELGVDLGEFCPFVGPTTLELGMWNSLHSGPTGVDGRLHRYNGLAGYSRNNQAWYEADYFVGLAFHPMSNFTLSFRYRIESSPNDFFDTMENLEIWARYDDASLWSGSEEETGIVFNGLQPHVMLLFELDGELDMNPHSEGVYLELGLEPGFELFEGDDFDIDLTIPMTLGLSLDDYYEYPHSAGGTYTGSAHDRTFGFFDIGVQFDIPLKGIPKVYGLWNLSASFHGLFLGGTTEQFNGSTTGRNAAGFPVKGFDDSEVYGTIGLEVRF